MNTPVFHASEDIKCFATKLVFVCTLMSSLCLCVLVYLLTVLEKCFQMFLTLSIDVNAKQTKHILGGISSIVLAT